MCIQQKKEGKQTESGRTVVNDIFHEESVQQVYKFTS